MTRIIAGVAGGRLVKTPTGRATRPTTDRVREALFSSIEASEGSLEGLRFLDLYAGSGAVGLEARSRGALAVTLVEVDRSAASMIHANARALQLNALTVICARAERAMRRPPPASGFDVAFLDPPYDVATADVEAVVGRLQVTGWLAQGALVIVERATRAAPWTWPDGLEEMRWKAYGETTLWYGRNVSPPARTGR